MEDVRGPRSQDNCIQACGVNSAVMSALQVSWEGGQAAAMRVVSAGHAFFAAIFLVLGIQGLIKGDFAAIWQTVGREVPAREVLIYLCAVVSLAGIGLVLRSVAATADM